MDPFVLVRKIFLIGNVYFNASDTQPSAYQHRIHIIKWVALFTFYRFQAIK